MLFQNMRDAGEKNLTIKSQWPWNSDTQWEYP